MLLVVTGEAPGPFLGSARQTTHSTCFCRLQNCLLKPLKKFIWFSEANQKLLSKNGPFWGPQLPIEWVAILVQPIRGLWSLPTSPKWLCFGDNRGEPHRSGGWSQFGLEGPGHDPPGMRSHDPHFGKSWTSKWCFFTYNFSRMVCKAILSLYHLSCLVISLIKGTPIAC